jgi:hypothetical protein
MVKTDVLFEVHTTPAVISIPVKFDPSTVASALAVKLIVAPSATDGVVGTVATLKLVPFTTQTVAFVVT